METSELKEILEFVSTPFYYDFSFWIGTIIGLVGLFFSFKAFIEARQAKKAAFEMGKIVKIQTITIELSEIVQGIDKLDSKMSFSDARNLLSEISRKIRRLIAPFQDSVKFSTVSCSLKKALDDAKSALDNLTPEYDVDNELPSNSVYFALQGHFSNIGNLVAEMMGLCEKTTLEDTNNG